MAAYRFRVGLFVLLPHLLPDRLEIGVRAAASS
jgi:hypothetical protein